jgi:hypothetical protein
MQIFIGVYIFKMYPLEFNELRGFRISFRVEYLNVSKQHTLIPPRRGLGNMAMLA